MSARLLGQLGIAGSTHVKSQTAGGLFQTQLFEVSLTVLTAGLGNILVQPNLIVMQMPRLANNIEVLVGLDILLNCKLLLDGPARQFHLEF